MRIETGFDQTLGRVLLMSRRGWIGSSLLLATVVATGGILATWKYTSLRASDAAAASQPEPMELVTVAVPKEIEHRPTTTSIGTVLALRSITLRNEVAGTVSRVRLAPGQIVEAGSVLLALDTSVEKAELEAQEAQAKLTKTSLDRLGSFGAGPGSGRSGRQGPRRAGERAAQRPGR
jgi:membrane fusion protein (multidrug efflux system)